MLTAHINAFISDLNSNGYSENTVRTYRYALNKIARLDLQEVKLVDLIGALSENWDPNTVAARQAAVKSFFKWLYEKQVIEFNIAEGLGAVRLKEVTTKPIPQKDIGRITEAIRTLPAAPGAYFFALLDLGLQANETLRLDVEDVCWEKGQEGILVRHGNGEKKRTVPLTLEMPSFNRLKKLCLRQKTGPLFTTKRKARATYDWAYYWWSLLMQKLEMDYTMHQIKGNHTISLKNNRDNT